MIKNKTLCTALLAALCVLLVTPAESQAFWLFGHHRRSTYRPVVVASPVVAAPAPACNSCAQTVQFAPAPAPACSTCTQTVRYAPQTVYRNITVNRPVTTYRPVTTADPCTGCARTTLRPVTTYVQQVRRVPYTAYRPVVSQVYRPVAGCSTCAVAAPCSTCNTTASYAAPAMGCSTCAATPAPSLRPMTSPAPASGTPTPATPQPSLLQQQPQQQPAQQPLQQQQPAGQQQAPQTFKKPAAETETEAEAEANGTTELQPIPQSGTNARPYNSGLFQAPRLLDPQDRTTGRQPSQLIQQAVHTMPVDEQERLDAQGWRAAR